MSKVVIYTKPGCPYCAAAKEDMDKRGVTYTEHDVTASGDSKQEAIRLAGVAKVPVIVTNGDVQVGFGGS
ncbi:MAG: glutaredoxin family protein [Gaiellales bacterium]|nr:MAG: glutaredoxin family protein [Gaiellales bacterium]